MDKAGLRICVADDDEDVLRAAQRLLRTAGFGAETFGSAEDFLESRRRAAPHCLVLDVHLRGLSGFDLQDQLAASGHSIPIVFITAHDDAAMRERAGRGGAAEYLSKPFEDQSLIEAIHRAINRTSGRDLGSA